MDANEIWRIQLIKNETGSPKFKVWTDPDTPEQEFMVAWMDKWHEHFSYFNNEGCGCCVNIYQFDAPWEAVAEIPPGWIEPRAGADAVPGT